MCRYIKFIMFVDKLYDPAVVIFDVYTTCHMITEYQLMRCPIYNIYLVLWRRAADNEGGRAVTGDNHCMILSRYLGSSEKGLCRDQYIIIMYAVDDVNQLRYIEISHVYIMRIYNIISKDETMPVSQCSIQCKTHFKK